MYFLSIISSIILTVLFISRGKFVAAALASAVAIIYTFGIVYDAHKTKKEKLARESDPNFKPYQPANEEVLAEIKEMSRQYLKNMRIFRNAAFSFAIISAAVVFLNESLAIAIAIVALAAFFKFFQNRRAVRKIKQGLSDRGYDPAIINEGT